METQNQTTPMLELLLRPAFCVSDGRISKINSFAAHYLLDEGTAIAALLVNGQEEYRAFTEGCLYLTLSIGSQQIGATVIATEEGHLFVLEQPSEQTQLQALALAARELRVPLSGMANTLGQMSGGDPQQMALLSRRLYQMMRLVSNMSDAADFSQADEGRMEYVEACSFLQELLDKTAIQLNDADIHLRCILPNQPIYTLMDAPKLERAVYNLISNAAKHTKPGGSIQVSLVNRGRLYLSVTDDGPGISSGVIGSIYRRYLRTPSITDGQDGIGLGMVLVRATAALHGGTVLIDHPEGKHTRVTMTLAIKHRSKAQMRCPVLQIDYAGERDHGLQELADVLPATLYTPENI